MRSVNFRKNDPAFPRLLAKKLNDLQSNIVEVNNHLNDIIDDENVRLDTTYSSQKIMELVAEFGFTIKVVDTLPARGRKNTLYFVPASEEVHEYYFLRYNDTDLNFYGCTITAPNPEYQIGDIIKPTIDNEWGGTPDGCGVISSVNPDFCESEEGDGFDGVTGTITWQKDHYYEITDIVEFKGAVTGDTLGKAFIFEEYDGTPASFVECEELPGCFLYKQEPSQDIKDEYIWVNSQWEKIGSTRIDLSQYYTKADTNSLLAGKSNIGHTHIINDTTGLQDALDSKEDKKFPEPICFEAQTDNVTISIRNLNGNTPNIEFSIDNCETWELWGPISNAPSYTQIVLTNTGDKVYMRGMNTNGFSFENLNKISYFHSTGTVKVSGNIMSLIDYTKIVTKIPNGSTFKQFLSNNQCQIDASELLLPATELTYHCYYEMFYNTPHLTKTPKILPATKLAERCYQSMFIGCTDITAGPEMYAEELADYCCNGMFGGCTGLTSAPELPATTLANGCYQGMFVNCSSLTIAPGLPAIKLAIGCYTSMFQGCTALTTAPQLFATILASNCYSHMFNGCSGLTTAPELPATTLASGCYSYMFVSCTSLIVAPELPAQILTENCYNQMFYGCTNLNYIKCLAVNGINQNNSTYYWVNGVATAGTFIKESLATSWPNGNNGIPTNWTVINHYDDVALENKLDNKQDTLTEGTNISINNNTVSAKGYGFDDTKESFAEGNNVNTASGNKSHAEGFDTLASGNGSHAEGIGSEAIGANSHAEGDGTAAYGDVSHAEGVCTVAGEIQRVYIDLGTLDKTGREYGLDLWTYITSKTYDELIQIGIQNSSIIKIVGFENWTYTINSFSPIEIDGVVRASFKVTGGDQPDYGDTDLSWYSPDLYTEVFAGNYSHAEGAHTKTTNAAEHAEGKYNKSNLGTIHSIGIGHYDDQEEVEVRKNAVEVLEDGKVFIHGLGGYNGTNPNDAEDVNTIVGDVNSALQIIIGHNS